MKRNSGTQSLFLKKVKNIMLIAKEYNDVNENNSFQKGNFSNISKHNVKNGNFRDELGSPRRFS